MVTSRFSPPCKIVVGIDGSDISIEAAGYAALLAERLGAEVIAVHAVGLMSLIDGEHRPSEGVRDLLDEQACRWCEQLDAAGVPHRRVLEDGPPGLVLMRVIEREGADLVVLGTRGIGSAEGAILGSTSYHLIQHSTVPVLVVPPPPL